VRVKGKLAVAVAVVGLLTGCDDKGNPPGGGSPEEAQANKVLGRALDTQGKPLPNAQIYVGGVAVTTTPQRGSTNAEGRYTIAGLVDQVTYKAYGWLPLSYQGKDFCLRLAHDNSSEYEPFVGKDGAVRNFRWSLQGRIGDSSADPETDSAYFGGGARLFPEFADGDFTGTVELQLTPTGPLIDGSQGQPLTRSVDLSKPHFVVDIPVGPYKVTATRIKVGGDRSALLVGPSETELASEGTLEFQPETFPTCGSQVASSGVKRAFLYVAAP
jgi:hypothetical protein